MRMMDERDRGDRGEGGGEGRGEGEGEKSFFKGKY
jgi:hypothetical protein